MTKTNTTAIKFTKQVIGVTTNPFEKPEDRVKVAALVLGDLAVHGGLGGADGYTPQNGWYVVTHVPSGYKLAEGYKQRNCKRLVEQLHALNLNWKFDVPSDAPDEIREIATPIIRAFNSDTTN